MHRFLLLLDDTGVEMPELDRIMMFIDGENLVFRYQAMLNKGWVSNKRVEHIPDVFVWNRTMPDMRNYKFLRAAYYTYAVGDENRIEEIRAQIRSARFRAPQSNLPEFLTPVVFHKKRQQAQNKGVDIQLTVDMLSQVYNNTVDAVFLISGDGDYKPLIEEIKRRGKTVYIGALSNGLNKELPYLADMFIDIDRFFVTNPEDQENNS